MAERIKESNISNAYIEGMARYSIINNYSRSFPDAKDGLKPVQRRVIYDMAFQSKAVSRATKLKSAAITGSVTGKLHPHSEDAVYGSMKPLANSFECKMPLIVPQGSFGNINGGPASAKRYTEAYLSPFAIDCVIAGLNVSKSIVDWRETYDNRGEEPVCFPATVPLLLINGTSGIGVGASVDIPQHSLAEVVDATLTLIDNPKAPVVLIPDHCLACDIIDTDWKSICNKGSGSYRARAIIDIIEEKGFPVLVIKSLPTYGTKRIVTQIESLIAAGKLPQISTVDDETTFGKIDIRIKLKKGTDAQFVREAIFKYTACEESFKVNFEVIDGIEMMRMSYKSYLENFIQFAMSNKFRQCCARFSDLNTRLHKLDAFIKTIRSGEINKIIQMIQKRKTTGDNELIEFLIAKVGLTDIQATYIINTPIKQLSQGHLLRYEDESKKIHVEADMLERMIKDDNLIKEAVKADLIYAKEKYGTPRLCKVIKVSNDGNIPQGTFKLVITENNYVRKLSENDPINIVKGDRPKYVLTVDNTEAVLLFDNKGRVFRLPVHKVPIVGKSDPGMDIRMILKGLTANIIAVIYEPILKKAVSLKKKHGKFYIAVLSRMNTIKKLEIEDFLNVPPSGIIYSKVAEHDDIVSIQIVSDNLDLIVYSGHKALRIQSSEIPCYKRNTLGIAAMNSKDPLEGMSIIYPDSTSVVVVTKSGMINKFSISGFARSSRNKAGSSVIKLKRGDSILYISGADENHYLSISTTTDGETIAIKDIPTLSSISAGQKMISTKSDIILHAEIIANQ